VSSSAVLGSPYVVASASSATPGEPAADEERVASQSMDNPGRGQHDPAPAPLHCAARGRVSLVRRRPKRPFPELTRGRPGLRVALPTVATSLRSRAPYWVPRGYVSVYDYMGGRAAPGYCVAHLDRHSLSSTHVQLADDDAYRATHARGHTAALEEYKVLAGFGILHYPASQQRSDLVAGSPPRTIPHEVQGYPTHTVLPRAW
jgi:hypothetical protein